MAEYTANTAQTVNANNNVLLTSTPVKGSNSIIHREGSGLVTLRGITQQCRARFKVTFGGNIAVPTGGTAEAISLAINRKELCSTVLNGAAEPASSFLNPGVPGHDDKLKTYEHNVKKAKQVLADAGISNPTFTCKVRQKEEKIATALQAYLKEAGITMNVETIDAGIWSSARAAGELQATVLGWFPLYADADNQMYTYYYSENAVGKGVFYNNPEFDSLMKEARESNDSDKRVELYKKADYILSREDYGTIPLYYGKLQFVAKPYVKNAKLGNLIYHLYNIDIDLSKK